MSLREYLTQSLEEDPILLIRLAKKEEHWKFTMRFFKEIHGMITGYMLARGKRGLTIPDAEYVIDINRAYLTDDEIKLDKDGKPKFVEYIYKPSRTKKPKPNPEPGPGGVFSVYRNINK